MAARWHLTVTWVKASSEEGVFERDFESYRDLSMWRREALQRARAQKLRASFLAKPLTEGRTA